MKAMILNAYGGPEVLQLADLPVPQPSSGEVLIRVQAVSVNPVDFKRRKNWQHGPFPVILGWDVSGTVTALGEGVTQFKLGDEVFGMIRFPGEGRAYAEYATAPESDIALKPSSLSFVEAAAITLAPLTAHQALEKMNLQAGQTLLIHAAAGGVGHFAVQLAKARGARVIGTASSQNRDFVLGLGADEFVDYHEKPFEHQVSSVDAVLDGISGENQTRSLEVLKPGGTLVSIVGPPPTTAMERAAQRGIQATNILVYPSREQLEFLSSLVESGQLKPHISQTFPLERVADAHRTLETGRTVGKIVLEVV
jgi:NADPH:quinone reductase-like Zn-dependent oxidoreductase